MHRFGSSLSVLDFAHLGATVSLRSFGRLGSAMSVFDFAHLGSTLSVRGIMRFGSRVESCAKLQFSSAINYIQETDSAARLGFYVQNVRGMSITNAGGTLHGTWTSDVSISTSDRSLKENIKPLQETLRKNMPGGAASTKPGGEQPSASSWLLRQLRPVSYNFRQGNEAKYMRFGFIADELEQILPQVVRELPGQDAEKEEEEQEEPGKKPDKKKGVVYTDLIAVLTTVVKDFNMQLKGLQGRMKTAEGELERLDHEDPIDGEEDV